VHASGFSPSNDAANCFSWPASASARPASRARDEDPGAAIGAGVVAAMRGVGLQETDAIDGRRQRGRGDLAMHGAGAIANSAVPTLRSKPPSSRSEMLQSAK